MLRHVRCIALITYVSSLGALQSTAETITQELISLPRRWHDICAQLSQPSLLRKEDDVHRLLLEVGWYDVSFRASDGCILHGMLRPARGICKEVVIIAPGMLFPCERLATFHALINDPHIALYIYSGRGIGLSQGSLWSLKSRFYGSCGHLDVLGALELLHHTYPNSPITLIGICAGGFHTLRAICALTAAECTSYHLKRVIIDSGFYDTHTISETALAGYFQEQTRIGWLKPTAYWAGWALSQLVVKPFLLTTSVDPVEYAGRNIPTIFIHAEQDAMARWHDLKPFVDKLCSLAPNNVKAQVIPGETRHALNHVKHSALYTEMLGYTSAHPEE